MVNKLPSTTHCKAYPKCGARAKAKAPNYSLRQCYLMTNLSTTTSIIKRTEVRTKLLVFTKRQHKRDNGRLSVNSLAVIQIICKASVLMIGGAKT